MANFEKKMTGSINNFLLRSVRTIKFFLKKNCLFFYQFSCLLPISMAITKTSPSNGYLFDAVIVLKKDEENANFISYYP